MAITLTKTKIKPVKAEDITEADLAQTIKTLTFEEKIDQAAELETEIDTLTREYKAKLKALSEPYKELVAELKGNLVLPELPTATASADGHNYVMLLEEESRARVIKDKGAIFVLLDTVQAGLSTELATIPLGAIDKYLTEDQKAGIIKWEYNGPESRKVTFMKKAVKKSK